MPLRSPFLLLLALGAPALGCDAGGAPPGDAISPAAATTPPTTSPAPAEPVVAPSVVVDARTLANEALIPDAVREKIRAMPVAVGHVSGHADLVDGLVALAQHDPIQHAYPIALAPGRSWYHHHGGLAHYSVGEATRPDEMVDTFTKRVATEDLGNNAQALYLAFDPTSFPNGTRTELAYKQYTTTMDVNASRVQLKGVFTETLFAPRIITTSNATFYGGEVPYPIELPNVAVDAYRGTAQVPSGAVGDDGGDDLLSRRDPRVVYSRYQEAMASITQAHPTVAMIYATVPLTPSGNYQRNYYNAGIRAWCARHHQPLFDVASLLSHDQEGRLVKDAEGERLAPDYTTPGTSQLNVVAKERLARGWWLLLAQMQGWKPS